MPFKSKKQKEKAARRNIYFSQKALATYTEVSQKSASSKPANEKNERSPDIAISENLNKDYSYIKGDLIKIAAFCALIFTAQVLIKIIKF